MLVVEASLGVGPVWRVVMLPLCMVRVTMAFFFEFLPFVLFGGGLSIVAAISVVHDLAPPS